MAQSWTDAAKRRPRLHYALPAKPVHFLNAMRVAAESATLEDRSDPLRITIEDDSEQVALAAAVAGKSGGGGESNEEWLADMPGVDACRPYWWWIAVVTHHAHECNLPPGACPVPCCAAARMRFYNEAGPAA